VNDQVHFRCRQRIWSEERCLDDTPQLKNGIEFITSYIAMAREAMDNMEDLLDPFNFLFIALEEFQRRNITMDDDALNAMAGFLRRVAEAGKTEMIEGLPAKILPAALIFTNRMKTFSGKSESRRRKKFPSWSWAGWRAPSF